MTLVTFGQALRNAIEAERASERFYTTLAEGTEDEEARGFLTKMAQQEGEHAEALAKMATSPDVGRLPERADTKVELIETAPAWALAEGVTLKDALGVALEAEQQAALYYDALADAATGPVADFFHAIARTETEHAGRLERMRAKF